jgi:phosphatidylglycerophosphate synthase
MDSWRGSSISARPLGAYLNELGDVVSDAALYLPFALVKPFSALSVGTVICFALLAEFAERSAQLLGVSVAMTANGEKRSRARFRGTGVVGRCRLPASVG